MFAVAVGPVVAVVRVTARLAGWSVSARIAALTALAMAALLVVIGALVQAELRAALVDQVDQRLAEVAAALPDDFGTDGLRDAVEQEEIAERDLSDQLVQLVDRADRLVQSSEDADVGRPYLPAADLARARGGQAVLSTVGEPGDGDDRLRVLAVAHSPTGSVLLVAAELEDVTDTQGTLLGLYGPLAVVGSMLAGVLGLVIASRGLAPLRRMTTEAEVIGTAEPSRRLSTPPRRDEVGRLAQTLNTMLARLDAALGRERQFTADASHELRTPLAIVRAEVELARGRVDDPRARGSLDSALEEIGRMSGMVDDLLVLARVDASRLDAIRPVDVGELAATVASRFVVLAEQRGVQLRHTGDAVVRADARGLERAVANLVDNALRHTPRGGQVCVSVQPLDDGGARLSVTDTGPGTSPDDLARLFDRLHQAHDARVGEDGWRQPTTGGAGLGLSIVAAVAAAHGGTVAASNREAGGLEVSMDLPA